MSLRKERVAELKQKLKEAPKKPPRTLAAVIAELRPALIEAKTQKNWTYVDIQAWLDKEGVKISIAALRKYLAEGRAKRTSKGSSAGRPAKSAGEVVQPEAPPSSGDAKPSPVSAGEQKPVPSWSKSLVAMALTHLLSEKGQKVFVIDADTSNPDVFRI
jgi:hypothetical protein